MTKGKNDENNSIELRSEELQDIVGRMPSILERYGIIAIAVIVLVMIIGTYFFKYPDTLEAQVIITNSKPAANIVARTTGNIEYVNSNNGGMVAEGEVLAILESTADYEDVISLSRILKKVELNEIDLGELTDWMKTKRLRLGNMQYYYTEFYSAVRNLHYFNVNSYYQKKIEVVRKRLSLHYEKKDTECHQYELQEKQEQISREIFLRDSMLYTLGMLSEEEYGRAEQTYMQSRKGAIDRQKEEIQHHMQLINEQENLLNLTNEQFLTTKSHEQAFYSALQDLNVAIKSWEEMYVMRSPTEGILNQMGVYGKNRYVLNGETLFFVIPKEQEKTVGKALLPASGAGKVEKGQRVIVSVNNFPEEEFGSIYGCVSTVSNIPTADGHYIVDIDFPNGLNTIFHNELPTSHQFMGNARFIIKDRRLIELFIQPIKIILSNNT